MNRSIPWLRVLIEGVVIVGSILLAFGCQPQDQSQDRSPPIMCDIDRDSLHVELEAARALWRSNGGPDYLMETRGWTNVFPGAGPWVELTVRGDTIRSVAVLEVEGRVAFNNDPQAWYSVRDLFDSVESFITDADYVEVTFDDALGYPARVVIDLLSRMADDELSHFVRAVEVRRE